MVLICYRPRVIGVDGQMAMIKAAARKNERAIAAAVSELTVAFGNRLVASQSVCEQHGHTTTWHANQPPDAVVFPQSTADVQTVVRICAKHNVPVISFGAGTSLEGQINAPFGGISIDVRDMSRVLAVHAEDLDCVIEPGITRKQLNEYLRDQACSFRSTRVPTHRSAAWRRPAPPAPMRCAMAR